MRVIVRAHAKINLHLQIGARRADGFHDVVTVLQSLALHDTLTCEARPGPFALVCDRADVPLDASNLVWRAARLIAEHAGHPEPANAVVTLEKRIPMQAGLGGGSADAAAVLRLAAGEVDGLEQVAALLGADVMSQLEPRFALVGGVGERVEPLPAPGEFAVVLVPFDPGLRAGDVYAEADRLGLGRSAGELDELEGRLRAAAVEGASPLAYRDLLVNDLQEAAVSLRPEIGEALAALRETGAGATLVTGSGPTAVGIFEHIVAADRAAGDLPPRYANAIVSAPAGTA